MSEPIEEQESTVDAGVTLRVVGVGGAGGNIAGRLAVSDLESVTTAAVNCDLRALNACKTGEHFLMGRGITRGLGAGGDLEIGKQVAEAETEQIPAITGGADLCFVVAGLGGGFGSGAAPVIAGGARANGSMVIAFVTLPFTTEGGRRARQAEEALARLREECHAVIPLPNDLLLQQAAPESDLLQVLAEADAWIDGGIRSLWSVLMRTGLINLDLASVKSLFPSPGMKTLFGLGEASGEDYVERALKDLFHCPLLHLPETSRSADSLLVNLVSGTDLKMSDVNRVMAALTERFGSRENTFLGAVVDPELSQGLRICVLGGSDLGNERFRAQRKATAGSAGSDPMGADGSTRGTGRSGKRREIPDVPDVDFQSEFDFSGEEMQRGYFDKTMRNLWNGEDLDQPTYLRKGVKLPQ